MNVSLSDGPKLPLGGLNWQSRSVADSKADLFQQSMQLSSSGQTRVIIFLGVAAMPAHRDEPPVTVAIGKGHSVLAKHSWPQSVHL